MKIMNFIKWAGISLVAGLAAVGAEIARNKNRCDYVRHHILGLHDAPTQQIHAPSLINNVQKQVK